MFKHPTHSDYTINAIGEVFGPRKKLNPTTHHTGYHVVSVTVDGKQVQRRVHRLVWESINNELIPDGLVINHIDGNKTNNHPSNLEVCTCRENTQHAHANQLAQGKAGEENSQAKLSNTKAMQLFKDLEDGMSNTEAGIKYELHSRYVSLIRHKRRWKKLWQVYKGSETIPSGSTQ